MRYSGAMLPPLPMLAQSPPEVAAFRRLVATGRGPEIVRALDGLAARVERALAASPAGADAVADRAVRPFLSPNALPTEPESLTVRAARGSDRFHAVWVGLGANTRLVLFRCGVALRTFLLSPCLGPVAQVPWKPGAFLAYGLGIQDAGMQTLAKVWLVSPGGIRPVASGAWSLESDRLACEVGKSRLVVRTLDDPRGFSVARAVPVLLRTTVLTRAGTRTVLGQKGLRAVDAFMVRAYAAPRPDALQATVRRFSPSPPFVEPTEGKGRVTLADGERRLVFALSGGRVVGVAIR